MGSLLDITGLLCLAIDSGTNSQIVGRTKLQKILYFCKYINWDVGRYRLHHYGPFSFEVADILNVAKTSNIVKESTSPPYEYSLTTSGNQFLAKFVGKICDTKKVNQTRLLVEHLSNWSKEDLELAATIDYVHNNNPKLTKKFLIQKVGLIKSDFSKKSIERTYYKWVKLKK